MRRGRSVLSVDEPLESSTIVEPVAIVARLTVSVPLYLFT
jgi:hypothetical protein